MSSNKKGLLRTVLTANRGCNCCKTKPCEVHEPVPKPKVSIYKNTNPSSMTTSSSSTTSGERNGGLSVEDEDFTSTTMSEAETTTHDHNKSLRNNVVPRQSPLVDSVAVEKVSADPYHDFRHSMLQMIFEKEIDSENDLQDLLQCFLQLNAPSHHYIIVKAFNEICEEAFPDKVSCTTPAATEPSPSRRNHIIIRKGQ